jgi:serine/threonine protein kinase
VPGKLQLSLGEIPSGYILNVSMEKMAEGRRIVLKTSVIAVKVLLGDGAIAAEEFLKDVTLLDRGVAPMQVDDKLIEVPLERLHAMFGITESRLRKRVESDLSEDFNLVLRDIVSRRIDLVLHIERKFNPEALEYSLSDSFGADYIAAKADKRKLEGITKMEPDTVLASQVSFIAKVAMAKMVSQGINRAVYFPLEGLTILNLLPPLNGSYEDIPEPVVEYVKPHLNGGEIVSGADKVMYLAWKVFSGEEMCSLHYKNKIKPSNFNPSFLRGYDGCSIVEGLENIGKDLEFFERSGVHRLERIKWEIDTLWELRNNEYITSTHAIFYSKKLFENDIFRNIRSKIKDLRNDIKKMIREVKGGGVQRVDMVKRFRRIERWYTEIRLDILEMNRGVEDIRLIQPFLSSDFRGVIRGMRNRTLTNQDSLELYDWILKAALGLKVLHDRGIIHRDIKHENIIGKRLGDLGLSCKEGKEEAKRRYGGTPIYSSPLVAALGVLGTVTNQHVSRVGKKDDIYSFGVLVYEAFNRGRATPPVEKIGARANRIFSTNRARASYVLRTLGRGLLHQDGLKMKITYTVEEPMGVCRIVKEEVELMGYREYNNIWRGPHDKKSPEYLSWMCTRLDPTRRPNIDAIISFARERIAELKGKIEEGALPILKDVEKRDQASVKAAEKSSVVHLPSLPTFFQA